MARRNLKDDFIDKIIEGSKDVEKCFRTSDGEINYGEAIEFIIHFSELSDFYTQEHIKTLEDEYAERNNVDAKRAKREIANALIFPIKDNGHTPIGIKLLTYSREGKCLIVTKDYFTDEQQKKIDEVYNNLRKRYEYLEPVVKKYGNIVHNYRACRFNILYNNERLNQSLTDWQEDGIKLQIKEAKARMKKYEEEYLKQGIDLAKIIDTPSSYESFKELSRQEDVNKMKNKDLRENQDKITNNVVEKAVNNAMSMFGDGKASKPALQTQKIMV